MPDSSFKKVFKARERTVTRGISKGGFTQTDNDDGESIVISYLLQDIYQQKNEKTKSKKKDSYDFLRKQIENPDAKEKETRKVSMLLQLFFHLLFNKHNDSNSPWLRDGKNASHDETNKQTDQKKKEKKTTETEGEKGKEKNEEKLIKM